MKDFQHIFDSNRSTPNMPVLFVGHGSPMNGIEDNQFTRGFREVASTLPQPQAILCISAHWYTRGTQLTAMEVPRTIHDFYGFPPALYEAQYPAPGSPELAKTAQTILNPDIAELDNKWGLDHGAWTVLKHLYPEADIPVVQLSIDYTKNARWHFELAQQLLSLRKKGVLIVGSGNIIHNLRLVDFQRIDEDNYGYDWAIEAREKMNRLLLDGNFIGLINYTQLGKSAELAIPTPDHYLPLIYSLALKHKSEEIQLFNDKLLAGSLSMTSVKIG